MKATLILYGGTCGHRWIGSEHGSYQCPVCGEYDGEDHLLSQEPIPLQVEDWGTAWQALDKLGMTAWSTSAGETDLRAWNFRTRPRLKVGHKEESSRKWDLLPIAPSTPREVDSEQRLSFAFQSVMRAVPDQLGDELLARLSGAERASVVLSFAS
jgi:hypothetical protein